MGLVFEKGASPRLTKDSEIKAKELACAALINKYAEELDELNAKFYDELLEAELDRMGSVKDVCD